MPMEKLYLCFVKHVWSCLNAFEYKQWPEPLRNFYILLWFHWKPIKTLVELSFKFLTRRDIDILHYRDILHFEIFQQWINTSNVSPPVGIYLLRVNNRNTSIRREICSKSTIETPEQCHWRRSGVFIVNYEHISHFVLVFPL